MSFIPSPPPPRGSEAEARILRGDDFSPPPPPPPPIREVREGFSSAALAGFGWFFLGALVATLVWSAMS